MSVAEREKKILIFSAVYQPFSGFGLSIKEITDRLPENEYYLISDKFKAEELNEEKIANINVRRLGQGKKLDKYLYPFRAASYALILHKNIKFNFVWSIGSYYAGLAALFLKYKTKTPYLFTLYSRASKNFVEKYIRFFNPLYKQIYCQPKLTQAISKRLGKYSRGLGNHGEIILLPEGIDLNIYKNSLTSELKQEIKKELGVSTDEIVIITVATAVLENGVIDLIKAMNFLAYKIGIVAKLIILGAELSENKLRQVVREQGVEDKVLFIAYTDYKELVPYIEMADIFCGPSVAEGFGSYFLEAMALGTPIIATSGNIPDFLVDGESGLFCETPNPANIALAIEKLLKDKELYNKLVSQEKDLIIKKYSWDIIAQQMKRLFNKMVEG